MSLVVERSFETAGDVVAGAVSRRRHRLGRSQAPAPGTANEEEVVVELHAKRPELTGKALREARVHGLIGKGLPFDELAKPAPFHWVIESMFSVHQWQNAVMGVVQLSGLSLVTARATMKAAL